jgi:hypothetical protein
MSAGVSMASEQARFLFQDPNSLVTVLAIVWVILVPILFVAVWAGMRMPGARSRFLILLVSGAVCAVPPIGALQVARGVTIVAIVVFTVAGLVGITPWGSRKLTVIGFRAQLRRGIERGYGLARRPAGDAR